jgi:hypothetical protein
VLDWRRLTNLAPLTGYPFTQMRVKSFVEPVITYEAAKTFRVLSRCLWEPLPVQTRICARFSHDGGAVQVTI